MPAEELQNQMAALNCKSGGLALISNPRRHKEIASPGSMVAGARDHSYGAGAAGSDEEEQRLVTLATSCSALVLLQGCLTEVVPLPRFCVLLWNAWWFHLSVRNQILLNVIPRPWYPAFLPLPALKEYFASDEKAVEVQA